MAGTTTATSRWFTPRELLTAQGFPISPEFQKIFHGATSQFTRGVPAPASRSRSSVAKQIGNGVHLGVMGPVTLLCLLLFPEVEKVESLVESAAPSPLALAPAAYSSSDSSGSRAASPFSMAFKERQDSMKRRRKE